MTGISAIEMRFAAPEAPIASKVCSTLNAPKAKAAECHAGHDRMINTVEEWAVFAHNVTRNVHRALTKTGVI